MINSFLLLFLTAILVVVVTATTTTLISASSALIVDVSGSAGDLAALRLLAATPGTQISLITVCGNCGTSPMAAWARVRKFVNAIGLRSVKVVLGSSKSWFDRNTLDKSDDPQQQAQSQQRIEPTCRDNSGFLAPTANSFSSFTIPTTTSSLLSYQSVASSDSIPNQEVSDWGTLFNTFDLDSWFGQDEMLDELVGAVPSSWIETSMLPSEISSSSSATGTFITSARLSSPAATAIRDFLIGSAVKVNILVLSSSLTNLADYLRAEQDVSDLINFDHTVRHQVTVSKINEIHIKGGCFDSSASIFAALTGNSPKLTTSAKQRGEWNFAMDPDAASYVLSSSSSSSNNNNKKKIFSTIPKYLYTDDMMYYGALMTTNDWLKISTRLQTAQSVFDSYSQQQGGGGGATSVGYQKQFGGVEALVWLGNAFDSVQKTWMKRASDFMVTSGAGFLNVFRISEMFVALAVADSSVRRSLEQQVDTQPKRYTITGVDVGGVVQGNIESHDSVDTNEVRVYTRGPPSMIPFFQSISRYFFGFI